MIDGRNLRQPEKFMFCTVRIECKLPSGKNSIGTGFFYEFDTSKGVLHTIITNKHVVENAVSGTIMFNLADKNNNFIKGEQFTFVIGNFWNNFIPHPEADIDLCLLPIDSWLADLKSHGKNPMISFADANALPTDDQWKNMTAIEDVLVVGYPSGIWDNKNNLPLMRRGITSTHPNMDYRGKKEFLIDSAIYQGSSGSPIFIFNQGFYLESDSQIVAKDRILLIGINYKVHLHKIDGKVVTENIPTEAENELSIVSHIPNNLGIAIKSTKLNDFNRVIEEKIASITKDKK